MPSATINVLRLYSRRLAIFLSAASLLAAAEPKRTYSIEGRLVPAPRFAFLTISGAGNAYSAQTPVYWDGKFKFKKLERGPYTIIVYLPRVGEFRQTYSIGDSTADKRGRVKIDFTLNPSRASRIYSPKDRFTVPVRRLSIPDKARNEVIQAQKRLQKKDPAGALEHLEKAVEIAPQYSAAWNMMGTLAYQRRDWKRAEELFREAKEQDPDAFDPIVNLGGVLLNLGKFDEALTHNLEAVKRRPKDALANAQLGLTYIELKKPELAVRFLEETKRLDPGHFTYPQLQLSELYWKRGNKLASVSELEHFLRHHPDHPQAEKMRETIRQVRELNR